MDPSPPSHGSRVCHARSVARDAQVNDLAEAPSVEKGAKKTKYEVRNRRRSPALRV